MTDTPTPIPLGGYHTTEEPTAPNSKFARAPFAVAPIPAGDTYTIYPEPVTPRGEPPGETLLPCPFCGDTAQFSLIRAPRVECTNCNATTAFSRDEKAAVAAWNERAHSPSDLAALVRAGRIVALLGNATAMNPHPWMFRTKEFAALTAALAKFGEVGG